MKIEDFEKAQANIYFEHWLPEMREISPAVLMELWNANMRPNSGGPPSKAAVFNAALAIALRLSRGGSNA